MGQIPDRSLSFGIMYLSTFCVKVQIKNEIFFKQKYALFSKAQLSMNHVRLNGS